MPSIAPVSYTHLDVYKRQADLEQVVERILRVLHGVGSPVAHLPLKPGRKTQQDLLLDDTVDVPLVLVAHDLSPADMLQFKQSVFAGFVTDVGGKTCLLYTSRCV